MAPSLSGSRRPKRCSVLVGLLFLSSGACAPSKTVYEGGASFRTKGDSFEIDTGDGRGWRPFFPKGVNLAVATPGHYPGELAAAPEDYYRWLDLLAKMNCNVVRAYTLHFPHFYETFGRWNQDHPQTPIYLVQGIWLDELESGDYMTDGTAQMEEEIALVVDALHGQTSIDERRGKAYGRYRHDVSRYLMAWLPGHEMDGNMAAKSNKLWAPYTRYDGRYLNSPDGGRPIESWVGRNLDQVIAYELEKYGAQRPIGWSNWPALDPIPHPTEPKRFGQDVVDLDFGRYQARESFTAGLFVSYHVYPFNPEFIIYQPEYVATKDQSGRPNSYLGYLLDLKAHHRGLPLFITEFGVPSSMGVAHINPTAYDHGGYSEAEQADHVVDLYRAILQSGSAGAVVFELLDEWFKHNWMVNATTIPYDRGALWLDLLNPEESFGLVSFYPLADSVTVDGVGDDWGTGQPLVAQTGGPIAPRADGRDPGRTLQALRVAVDPAFLYLRVDTAPGSTPDLEGTVWQIGISTLGGQTGDRRFPESSARVAPELGLEAVVVLDQQGGVYQLQIQQGYDPAPRLNGRSKTGGRAVASDTGAFVVSEILVNGDEAYTSEGKDFVPTPRYYRPGLLRRGNATRDTSAHFELGEGVLEIRLPWHALWVTDPSSRSVLDDDLSTDGLDATESLGLRLVVLTSVREPGGLRLVDALPRRAWAGGELVAEQVPVYTWDKWDAVQAQERIKPVFTALQQAYGATP